MEEFEALFMALVGCGVLAACFFWHRSDFTIRVHRGKTECQGKLPAHLRQAVEEFLAQEMENGRSFKVQGNWEKKRLRLWFAGDLSRCEQQRIRNLLVNSR